MTVSVEHYPSFPIELVFIFIKLQQVGLNAVIHFYFVVPTKPPPKLTSPPQPTIPPLSTPTHAAGATYCEEFEAVGCYTSCATIPYLPKLLFIDTGLTEHYGDTLNQYTEQLVNRCAKEACINGYAYFGIASYGMFL